MTDTILLQRAAEELASADALLIGAGAGMGVDSGLPDFRGDQGFWRAYPPYEKLGLRFTTLANPRWFSTDPTLAWGFYGHRLHLYRATRPHAGFGILQAWGRRKQHGAFVYTSNVDGHFERAGFDPERLLEVHGTIHWAQCLRNCGIGLFPADTFEVAIDEATMRAQGSLPACPACGALARPNILLFGDAGWDSTRAYQQEVHLHDWLETVRGARIVVVECGAGLAIPTVRHFCEQVVTRWHGKLIRINPRESSVPTGHLGLAIGALPALQALAEHLPEGSS
jgi:NAD-dependent SIR2 family protein deacetylase